MKRFLSIFLILILCFSFVGTVAACNPEDKPPNGNDNPPPTPAPKALAKPFVTIDDDGLASWNAVPNAVKYVYKINNGEEMLTKATAVQLQENDSVCVKAVGDGVTYGESAYCTPVVYEKPIEVDGWYVLEEKTVQGIDVTRNYVCNTLKLEKGEAVWREIDITGADETIGTYEYLENSKTLRVIMGVTTYSFSVKNKGLQLTYSGTVNRKNISYVFNKDDGYSPSGDVGSVEFTQELFGDDITKNFYNYCPTVMMDGSRTMHIWYCSNKEDYNVTDYVAYRKGTLHDDGKWTFTDKQFVLEPTSGTWDARHVCDPSVVKGVFNYNGETYNYMMAYLGCTTSDNTKNEVGVAFAKRPEGPYVKASEINPVCDFYGDYGLSRTESSSSVHYKAWGYGQPSLVSVDKAGKVLFFFTNGNAYGTGCTVRLLDMSNVNDVKKLKEVDILPQGITNAGGGSDCINNADFAYDPDLARLYCVKEDFPYDSSGDTDWITSANTVFYMQLDKDSDDIFAPLFKPTTSSVWQKVGAISEGLTGYKRNHNCGIVTDEYGHLMSAAQLPIVYTMSDLASEHPGWTTPWGTGQWPALHTYRLHGIVFDLV